MVESKNIRKFEYRHFRMKADLSIEFIVAGTVVHGSSEEVNYAGIRAKLDGQVSAGQTGLLILRHQAGVLELEAQVVNVDKCQAGLVFHFQSDWERELTIEYIAAIADHAPSSLLLRYPF